MKVEISLIHTIMDAHLQTRGTQVGLARLRSTKPNATDYYKQMRQSRILYHNQLASNEQQMAS